nr:immunoglobulin light chain junction region [Macaca mulatta]MOW29380.1 immunoglobulin light chain junction region [Macaca mulatta]MOW30462.1 immunoglobulin light chain junction region [Macaca mulatta]
DYYCSSYAGINILMF